MVNRRKFLKLGGAALAGLAGCNSQTGETTRSTTTASREPTTSAAAETGDGKTAYTRVYEETVDSVVLVRTDGGQGTGFMFDPTHVVTNAHVVGQAETAEIRFSEGSWNTGEIAGVDPHSDLAAITVPDAPSQATPLPFVDAEPSIGQEVVAIGNPYNLNGSLTTGVISGLDRTIPAPTGYRIPDAVQTDAAVNPGNSGGPLVSLDGRVVAVINSGGGDNIGFGISAALTRRVVPRLIETGSYEHAFVGISFTDVTPTIADANDLDEARGLIVVDVLDGGPAKGVLQPSTDTEFVDGRRVPIGGDVLLTVDGTRLLTSEDFMSYLALQTRPGDSVDFTILRDGAERTVSLELGTRSEYSV